MFDQEEEAFKMLLSKKFEMFRRLLTGMIEHDHESARITMEQARRVAMYAHETYFRHLRLYDFVLKNTKLSEVKRVYIPVAEPKSGDDLNKAMVLADDTIQVKTTAMGGIDDPKGSRMQSMGAQGALSGPGMDPSMSVDSKIGGAGNITIGTDLNEDSVTDSDMDQAVREMP